jgi:hypothetical protein
MYRMRGFPLTAAAAISASLLTAPAAATLFAYDISLSGGAEFPPNSSPATGNGTVVYDDAAHSLSISLTFSGLIGTTVAAHIHAATTVPGSGTAGVATTTPTFSGFPLGVTAGSYAAVLDLAAASSFNPAYVTANGGTLALAELALTDAMASGKSYLNIHTTSSPGGEIRGFLTASSVPEPATWAMFIIGFGVSGCALRHARKQRGRTAFC